MAGQVWAVSSAGGYLWSDELSNTLRTALQPLVKFRQLCDAKDMTKKGLRRGQIFTWDIVSNVANQGGTLVETQTMPVTGFTITQGTGTVTEYGNSVPYSGKLDALSKFPIEEIINKTLKDDVKKTLDQGAYNQFAVTALRVFPSAGTATDSITLTTNGTCTGTNNVALGTGHVKAISDMMKERNIPPYMGDDYLAIGHPTTWRGLKNGLETLHQYVDRGFTMILNGEIGRYEGTRFLEQTNIAKETFTNAKSNWAYFMGEDTVAEALCIPEEIRGKLPGDFGRDRGFAWYYLGGFAAVHTTTDADQNRIVKWDSAA